MRRLWRNERGVAMVTVLLVGAALTAMTSAAAFVTIEEFGATQADRNAAQALSYAEAGIDRMLLKIRNNDFTWGNISLAGCDAAHPVIQIEGSIPPGTYRTTLEVYDAAAATVANRFRPAACTSASSSIGPDTIRTFLITSTGQQPQSRRLVRQVVEIKPLGLPVGVYAYDRVDVNGTVNLENISLISEKSVYNRDNLQFYGTDPYYKLSSFYPGSLDAATGEKQIPAAAHAKVALYYGPASKLTEHREPRAQYEPNCEANKGAVEQSLWDGSGTAILTSITRDCPNWPGSGYVTATNKNPPIVTGTEYQPPRARFTETDRQSVAPTPNLSEQDYLTLRTAAKQTGLYCSGSTTLTCSAAGGTNSTLTGNQIQSTTLAPIAAKSFVVYIDFANDGIDPFARDVLWSGGGFFGPCASNPADNRSAVIIVRRGSFRMSGGAEINGALLIPEGAIRSTGGFTLEGTMITRRLEIFGSATVRMSPCWILNMPGPFLDVTSTTWNEVDR